MKAKRQIVVLVMLILSVTLSAQESANNAHLKNDFGIFIIVPQGMPSLEYRMVLNNNYKLRLGLDHIIENTFDVGLARIISANDSVVVREYSNSTILKPTLRIGVDRQLQSKYLSVGLDFQIRYTSEDIGYQKSVSTINEQGGWGLTSSDVNSAQVSYQKNITYHYLMPAIRGNMTAQFPLGESFLFSIYYAGFLGTNIFIKETNRNDPLNEIETRSGYTIDVESYGGVGIRYLFKGDH